MAKGQVSEEELSNGLKGIGDFAGLNTSSRVRRDNPFRDSRAETPPSPLPVKTIDVLPSAAPSRTTLPNGPVPEIKAKVARNSISTPETVKQGRAVEKTEENGVRKADVFTERVTLQISPEMRDQVERLARELQRAKSSKKERITGNTVMRVAIRLITTRLQLKAGQAPNDEEELYELIEKVLTRTGS
jgi:hypothetical protein